MHRIISQRWLDRFFRVAVSIKGIDGVLEMLGGAALIVVPIAKIKGVVAQLALGEIAEDKHAFIANFILQLDHRLDPHIQLFAVLYLLGHGAIKIFLAVALLRGHYHLYPYAIAFLLAFILYQTYRIGYDHSVFLGVLTIFDCVVTWLTYLEWRRHTGIMRG
jgi:uncharacterized membrane protein